jgi:hypothetical protein
MHHNTLPARLSWLHLHLVACCDALPLSRPVAASRSRCLSQPIRKTALGCTRHQCAVRITSCARLMYFLALPARGLVPASTASLCCAVHSAVVCAQAGVARMSSGVIISLLLLQWLRPVLSRPCLSDLRAGLSHIPHLCLPRDLWFTAAG